MKKKYSICVIGLGYVGLPLLFTFSKFDFIKAIGFDINQELVNNLTNKISHIEDVSSKDISSYLNKKFKFTSNYKEIKKYDIFIICVPTPLRDDNTPDNSYLVSVANILKKIDLKNKLVINESTTYPGATKEIFGKIFIDQKLRLGVNCFLGFSPERVDPGNDKYKTINIPKLISGSTKKCLKYISAIYDKIFTTYKVSQIETAEFTKIYENIFRSINISFVNEMKVLTHKMNINIYEVIKAASTKPFGFMPFYPSPGFGGHCIPIDPYLLSWKAKKLNFYTRFIELSGQINESMPNYIVSNMIKVMTSKRISLNNLKLLIIGLSYKKNSMDIRETPAAKIIHLLKPYKIKLYYHDDIINRNDVKKNNQFNNIKYASITKKNLKKFKVCLILSDHDYVNYNMLQKNLSIIFDTRGRYSKKFKNVNQL